MTIDVREITPPLELDEQVLQNRRLLKFRRLEEEQRQLSDAVRGGFKRIQEVRESLQREQHFLDDVEARAAGFRQEKPPWFPKARAQHEAEITRLNMQMRMLQEQHDASAQKSQALGGVVQSLKKYLNVDPPLPHAFTQYMKQ